MAMGMASSSVLGGCVSPNAAAASAGARGGSFRYRPSASGGPGSGRCSSHVVAVRAEIEKGGNVDNKSSNGKSQGRRELLAGTLAGSILLPGGAALGGVEEVAPDLSKYSTAYPAAGVKEDDFPELGSRKARGNEEQDLGDKPVTLRVRPEPVAVELQGLDFEDLEKTLVLEGVLVPVQGNLAFSVFINFPGADDKTPKSIPQYVGSYQSIPQGKASGDVGQYSRADVRFSITANLEFLGIKELSNLLVTIVPQGTDTERGVKLTGAVLDLD